MQRKRGGWASIVDVFSGLDGPVKQALVKSPPKAPTPQSRYHFTQADQVNRLVTARESDPDLGFQARMMALCSLPRTNHGNRLQYVRKNGPYKLAMIAGAENKLPYGSLARLLMAWISTEAVKTQSPVLVLGHSLTEFMKKLDINSESAGRSGERTRLRNQMDRLFNSTVQFIYEPKAPDGASLRASRIRSVPRWPARCISYGIPRSPTSRSCGRARSSWVTIFFMTSFAIPSRST